MNFSVLKNGTFGSPGMAMKALDSVFFSRAFCFLFAADSSLLRRVTEGVLSSCKNKQNAYCTIPKDLELCSLQNLRPSDKWQGSLLFPGLNFSGGGGGLRWGRRGRLQNLKNLHFLNCLSLFRKTRRRVRVEIGIVSK